ncbi:MAG: phosphoglucomutase/phosphomannomutase family protein [Clostridia bacterium]|nr:phosphoglucomutase/phosphomannomutase family protein [Clostridia bacterium]
MIKFGTGGWRAIIGDEFIRENVRLLAQAISDNMKGDNKGIVIGYDRRFLSDMASKWAAEVFAGNGITVHFIDHIAPTPLVMFTVKMLGTKYGMAVTASHNPAEYNGIKVFTEGGRDADLSITRGFEEQIKAGVDVKSIDFNDGVNKGIIKLMNTTNEYLDSIIDMIDMDAIRKSGLKILLDPMYGVSKTSLQTILMTARCEVDLINDRHDTLFGGRLPSPSAHTLSKLRDMVVEQNYDLGIGTDGDADRIGIIDDQGTFIHPNEILALLSYYLYEYKGWRGDIVRNIATTHLLDKIAADYGQKCHEVPVGFKFISGKMDETDAMIGGESSGGLSIRGHIKGKDGIFASSLLVEMISVCGRRISEILNEIYAKYGKTQMSEFDTKFSQEKKDELTEILFVKKELPDFGIAIDHVSYEDGCKVYFEDGTWIIARFSGTEPLLRVFCEMETMEKAKEITDIWVKALGLA